MGNVFTKQLKVTTTCKNCKAEMPRNSMLCYECGAKNSYPEFMAALIIGGLAAMAMYALFQY
jgi:RNA polymerase subunit RPABC4/transcription elongation factor Spt4